MNDEGTEKLHDETIYNGGNATDIIVNGMYSTPTKESDAQYDYDYGGWCRTPNGDPDKNALKNISVDTTVYIAFNKYIKSYNIRFYSGNEMIGQTLTEYGSDAIYTGDLPIKTDSGEPDLYEFIGWQPKPEKITGEMNCYAQFYFIGSEDTVYQFVLSDFGYSLMDANEDGIKDSVSIDSYVGINTIGRILPSYDIDKSYTTYKIGESAFRYENTGINLEVLYLPDSISIIGQYAFWGCEKLTVLDLPKNLKRVEGYAFTNCKSLKEVNIPEGVTYIGAMGFYACGFSKVYIPKNVTYIGMYAFSYCENLEEITFSSDIDYESLTINSQTFDNCNNLKVINVPWSEGEVSGGATKWGATKAIINYNYVEEVWYV